MPVRYRKYYLQRLNETIEQQNEEMDKKFKTNDKGLISDNPMKSSKLPPPPIPDFATNARAPKK
jgi:hypothetical protein